MGPCHVIKAAWRRRGTRWDETAFKPGQGGKLPGIRTRRSQFGRFSCPGRKLRLCHKFKGINRTFAKVQSTSVTEQLAHCPEQAPQFYPKTSHGPICHEARLKNREGPARNRVTKSAFFSPSPPPLGSSPPAQHDITIQPNEPVSWQAAGSGGRPPAPMKTEIRAHPPPTHLTSRESAVAGGNRLPCSRCT